MRFTKLSTNAFRATIPLNAACFQMADHTVSVHILLEPELSDLKIKEII